ncbi:MAG: GntR family transcriptional regulator [Spirochaetales bacterium]|nr:GntR family transcriptional regulator [Spirochaetales bacterium]
MKPGINQLEPENLLSAKLGMSRETIRKAMSSLISEGIVSRWHGKGNFGHPEVTNLSMRIDINSDFRRILTNSGYNVKTVRSEALILPPTEAMLNRMPEASNKKAINFILYFYADNSLAIHCQVELLQDVVVKMPEAGEYSENINSFLGNHCIRESNHTTAWLKAGLNEEIAGEFGLAPTIPLLEWEEVYYDIFDFKMGYLKIYFHPEIMDLSLLLKF